MGVAKMSRRANCILLGTIIVAGAALRFYGISSKSLWLDEALSWRMQQFSVGEIVERCGDAAGTHPPLYFVVLHFWTRAFGDTEAAMRSLAGLLGTALILAVYVLCRALMLFPRRDSRIVCRQRASLAGLLAAALVALSPLHIHLSQQVRGYTLAVLMVLLAAISLLRALSAMPGSAADERGLFNRFRAERAAWWGAFVACAACATYTNHLAVVSVAAQYIFAAAYIASRDRQARGGKRSTQLFGLIAAGAVLAVAYLPWMPRLLAQSESLRHSWQKRTTAAQCAESVFAALVSTPVERLEPRGATSWASAACVAALMVAAGRSKSWGGKPTKWWYL